jgi:long-subunit fatty acid transport protein
MGPGGSVKKFAGWVVISGALMVPSLAQGSGLALRENSGAGQGSAFAGASAAAEDVSYMFHNPAGITRHGGENFAIIGTAIVPKAKFTKSSATTVLGGNIGGGNGGDDAGPDSIAPAIFYSRQMSDRVFLGASLTVPLGLSSQYAPGWVGRYHAIKSKITTYNFNPVIAYKATDKLSVAGGVQLARHGKPDLFLSDVVLPAGHRGPAIVEGARRSFGPVPAIFMSGHVSEGAMDTVRSAGDFILIDKPFELSHMAHEIRSVLDSSRG